MKNISELEPGASVLKELHRLQTGSASPASLSKWFGISPLTTDTASWYQGYVGEKITAETLKPLIKEGWKVYHSVPVGSKGSDIDHIVVSPQNVIFTLNTKHHKGKKIWVSEKQIRVNGQVQPYIRNSKFESERIAKKTGTPVIPVLVFVKAASFDIKPGTQNNGIVLADPSGLVKTLKKTNQTYTETYPLPETIEKPEFWSENFEDHTTEHDERVKWFKKLQNHHNTATMMRPVYGLVALAGFLAGVNFFMVQL